MDVGVASTVGGPVPCGAYTKGTGMRTLALGRRLLLVGALVGLGAAAWPAQTWAASVTLPAGHGKGHRHHY